MKVSDVTRVLLAVPGDFTFMGGSLADALDWLKRWHPPDSPFAIDMEAGGGFISVAGLLIDFDARRVTLQVDCCGSHD